MYSLLQAQYKNAVNEAEIAKLKAKVGEGVITDFPIGSNVKTIPCCGGNLGNPICTKYYMVYKYSPHINFQTIVYLPSPST
jgi:hypothetical protein